MECSSHHKVLLFQPQLLAFKELQVGEPQPSALQLPSPVGSQTPGDAPVHRWASQQASQVQHLIRANVDVSHAASDGAAAVGTHKGLSIPNSCLQRATEPATSTLLLQSKRSSLPHCKTLCRSFWTKDSGFLATARSQCLWTHQLSPTHTTHHAG